VTELLGYTLTEIICVALTPLHAHLAVVAVADITSVAWYLSATLSEGSEQLV
jgi:hypothetical protein